MCRKRRLWNIYGIFGKFGVIVIFKERARNTIYLLLFCNSYVIRWVKDGILIYCNSIGKTNNALCAKTYYATSKHWK